jgi:hypothetical protein
MDLMHLRPSRKRATQIIRDTVQSASPLPLSGTPLHTRTSSGAEENPIRPNLILFNFLGLGQQGDGEQAKINIQQQSQIGGMSSQKMEGQQNNVWPPWLTAQQQAPEQGINLNLAPPALEQDLNEPEQGINLNLAPPVLEQDLNELPIEEDVQEVPIPPVI